MRQLKQFISRQLRQPSGVFGRQVMTRLLDRGNTALIVATSTALDLRLDSAYLDVGFGGGLALREAATVITQGSLCGVDFSPDVVSHGQRRHASLIAAGRLTLLQADVGALPLRDRLFDRISTTNTVYFWPDPPGAAAEILRVLTPGGRLAIGYTGAEKMARYPHLSEGFTHYRPEQVEALLTAAGFDQVHSEALHGDLLDGDFVTLATRP